MENKKTSSKSRLSKKEFLHGVVQRNYVPEPVFRFMKNHHLENVNQLLDQFTFLDLWELQVLDNHSKRQLMAVLRKYDLLHSFRVARTYTPQESRILAKKMGIYTDT